MKESDVRDKRVLGEKVGGLSARGERNARDRTFIDGDTRITKFFEPLPSTADINNAMMDCIWTKQYEYGFI